MEVGTDQVLIEMLQVLLLSSVVTMSPSWNQPTSSGPSGQSAAAKTGSEAAAPRSQAARGECLLRACFRACLLSCSRVFPRAEQISPLRWSPSLTPLRRRRQQRRKTYRRTVRTQIARWILEEPSVSMATRSLLQRDGRTRGPLEKLAAWTLDGFLEWRDVGCRRTCKGRSP